MRIGKPYLLNIEGEGACPVEIVGLVGRTRDIVGIDPIQALKLAITFAESFVNDPVLKNKIFWPSGEVYDVGWVISNKIVTRGIGNMDDGTD